MGIFDFLRSKGAKSAPPSGNTPAVDKKIAGPAKVVADKRAQTYDRLEAIQALVDMKTPEAAAALLKRFNFTIDPSITDAEEKDLAFRGIVAAGKDVVPAVIEFCTRAEALTWPLKVLDAVLDEDGYREELLDLLEGFDTEYARNVEPKIQIIQALEEVVHDDVRAAVERFFEDVNETVRFHAVQTTFAQAMSESVKPMIDLLVNEESVRVKNKVAEGLLVRGWTIPEDRRDAVADALGDTGGYTVGEGGKIVKRSLRFG
ncbi:HEAT repeat domain-containing protein [Polyangium fumosum]|uniref:HEAT repeat domain-containing protein n=1 Tax=Polyangium fumosum TaxID=889272 RepID=A0A4U1J8Q9_9BACT|nr:HEAT repeat domain-containing protein [Polyangium fumosum]TKD04357.1 HEAT repeat domain-containing protein [Polyangium fumosum]